MPASCRYVSCSCAQRQREMAARGRCTTPATRTSHSILLPRRPPSHLLVHARQLDEKVQRAAGREVNCSRVASARGASVRMTRPQPLVDSPPPRPHWAPGIAPRAATHLARSPCSRCVAANAAPGPAVPGGALMSKVLALASAAASERQAAAQSATRAVRCMAAAPLKECCAEGQRTGRAVPSARGAASSDASTSEGRTKQSRANQG